MWTLITSLHNWNFSQTSRDAAEVVKWVTPGNGNGNGNQLGLYACMLAPTPGKSRYPGDGGKVSRWLIMTWTWTNSSYILQVGEFVCLHVCLSGSIGFFAIFSKNLHFFADVPMIFFCLNLVLPHLITALLEHPVQNKFLL